MQLAAVANVLPAPKMARGMQCIAACDVQGRLLAEKGQCGGQILVWAFDRVHTALGDINRARRTLRLAGHLVRHSSPVPGVNGPRKAFERGAAR